MIEGTFAIVAAILAFLVPLAIPLFIQRWRTFLVTVAVAAAIFAWLWFDIEASAGAHWLGSFLAGLMLFGFAFGAVAKFAMLLGRRPDEPSEGS
jgi:hypothetical protein